MFDSKCNQLPPTTKTRHPSTETHERTCENKDQTFNRANTLSTLKQNQMSGIAPVPGATIPSGFEVYFYRDLIDLRHRMQQLDHPNLGREMSMILELGRPFGGHLESLVHRRYPGARLFLLTRGQNLPGILSVEERSIAAEVSGWNEIVLVSECEDPFRLAVTHTFQNQTLVVFRPNWSVIRS